ncbi:MAG: insulinase family protein [bacterium]
MKKSTRFLQWPAIAFSFFVCVILSALVLTGCKKHDMHGFKLLEKRFVKEINADCYYYQHVKSGARLLKIDAKDPNKTFAIAFKTFPESDAGTPHILEHAVLNGSRNFPVKSPFDVLSKGSLNTFINAFTGKDMTMYPVASMNEKDYFNLMHVYLDAVFNPLIYADPRILNQEGWHYEITNPNDPVVYRGVVYNEMKGAFSDPDRVLQYECFHHLFPESPYGFESGGYPPAIPTLTHEQFNHFHTRYYHPENSYILLYGNAPLDKELTFIDSLYLTHYTVANNLPRIEDQKPFKKMKEVTAYYPVLPGAATEGQTFLDLGYVAGHNTDQQLTMGLDILTEVLVNQESAPIRLALQEAGIGQDVNASIDSYMQNVFQITAQNANPQDREKFLEIVNKTLQEQVDNGLDMEAVTGVLNRMEFILREGNTAQKGLTYGFQCLSGWFFADDPFLTLEWEKPLGALKKGMKEKYLESLITQHLLNNPHSLLLTLEPKPGMEQETSTQVAEELDKVKASISKDSIAALVKQTEELIAYQKQEDSPEALATIPLLELKDINPNVEWYQAETRDANGAPVLYYDDFTNKVVYVNLYFDLRTLPEELLPYASLLSNFLGILNTQNYTYGDLTKALNMHTGGFYSALSTFAEDNDDSKLIPKFRVTTKSMDNKLDKLFELSAEVLNKSLYNDTTRLRTILSRHQSQLDQAVKSNGFRYASRRLASYYSNDGMFRERTGGLDYYWFVTDLNNHFNQTHHQIIDNLTKTASLLFSRENLIAATTCSDKDYSTFAEHLETFIATLPTQPVSLNSWAFGLKKLNEGIMTPAKVQYVLAGYDYKKLGYSWDGKMRVLNQILSTDYLQTQIRVIGGAYGGFTTITNTGTFTFASYRDPNLTETVERYNGVPKYLSEFSTDEKGMTRYIIGTIAEMDVPLTASDKGNTAVSNYFTRQTKEALQQDRNAVLSATVNDIRAYAPLTEAILKQDYLCVYGNADKIQQDKKLFEHFIEIGK